MFPSSLLKQILRFKVHAPTDYYEIMPAKHKQQHKVQRCDGLLVSSKAVRSLYLLYSKFTFKKNVCPCLRTIMKVNAQIQYTSHCILHRG